MTSIDLPAIHITTYEWDPIVSPFGSGAGFGSSTFDREGPTKDGIFGRGAQGALYNWALANYDAITKAIQKSYSEKHKNLPKTLESELSSARTSNNFIVLPPNESIIREIALREAFIKHKATELAQQTNLANKFYGSSPINKTPIDLASRYRARQLLNTVKAAWSDSYTAAFNAKLLSEGISLLTGQSTVLNRELKAVEARIAAAKAAAAKAAADKAAAEATAKAAADKAKADKQIEADNIKDDILFVTNFYKEVAEKFGEKASALAKELAESAKSNKIRSADEAIYAFNKHKDSIQKKFGKQDREAIARAIDSLDKETLAKNLSRFSKGLGGVSKGVDLAELLVEFLKATDSGDWKPFLIKLEVIILGTTATFLVAAIFGIAATTPIGILTFAVLMAATSAYIDEKLIEKINKDILGA
ncbi:colicin-like pore-forming protein [Pseudomonas ogarae]|uniref:colicin-like pore-forming protein n=1 Tax=Pseudomonas ogarae (strain DSM 112162 / CECT 30235 / F113) TaxID=1114970 RepID=UPI00194F0B9D|nr:colicin-like pore-forming protein [Pseudomonas ogarae]